MKLLKVLNYFFIYLLISHISLSAQDVWPQFRGPAGSGISRGTSRLPARLDTTANRVWACPAATGLSSPCIWKDKIFITGRRGDSLETACINSRSGKTEWQRYVVPGKFERVHPVGHVATPTPATDGERVYSYFGSYGLVCYDYSGNTVWERVIPHQGNMYGTAVSPIIHNGMLIFSRDADAASYVEAIRPATGETIWHIDRPDFKGNWSTPMVTSVDGIDQLIIYGIWWMKAYSLTDGAEIWSFPGLTDEPIITPVAGEGLIFLTSYNMKTNPEVLGLPTWDSLLRMYDADSDSVLVFEEIKSNKSILSRYDDDGDGDHPLPGFFRWLDVDRNGKVTQKEWGKIIAWVDGFPHENALIALRPSGKPGTDPEVAWRYTKGVPECPSPLFHDGRVWMLADGGLLTCLEAATGKPVYAVKLENGGAYYASPVYGDGKIYVASARGVVTVIDAGREFNVLSTCNFRERILATPALAGGVVYIRTEGGVYAFN